MYLSFETDVVQTVYMYEGLW